MLVHLYAYKAKQLASVFPKFIALYPQVRDKSQRKVIYLCLQGLES